MTPSETSIAEGLNEAQGVIQWSWEERGTVCTEHGKEAVTKCSAGYSRAQHMPLHVNRCKICGAEGTPFIDADLGL